MATGQAGGTGGGLQVRPRTVSCGVGLAAVLLAGLALVGGAGDQPTGGPDRPFPEYGGPLAAIQPPLDRALLAGDDLPRTGPPATATGPDQATGPRAGSRSREPVPTPAPGSGDPAGAEEWCRALLADQVGLSEVWGATAPREVTSRRTRRADGGVLHQVLGVFESERAAAAYARLREAATSCDRVPLALADGTPVTVVLRELASGRPESHHGRPESHHGRPESSSAAGSRFRPAGQGYAVLVTIESPEGTRTGWLALDRLGPVVSLLRQLGPLRPVAPAEPSPELSPELAAELAPALAADLARTRRAALGKLRPVLEAIRQWRERAG
jgi:hypothetical protein